MTQVFTIRQLDPNIINPSIEDVRQRVIGRSSKLIFIGKPGTGKTTTLTSLIYEKRHCCPSGMVVSGTEDSNHHFSSIFPDTFIHDVLTTEKIENFIQRQKLAEKFLPNPWSLLVLDDCMDDTKIFNTPTFHKLYKNGRHLNMLYILSSQYSMDIKPWLRTCIDGVFLMRETNIRNRKKLYENYAGVIPSFHLFCKVMDEIANDYTALYIHNAGQSANWEDNVFWYKARPIPPDWKFGSYEIWDHHSARIRQE